MTWSQRFSQFSGRWSPFGRSPTGDAQVKDGDFSYITVDDLQKGEYDRTSVGSSTRETDLLTLKDGRGNAFPIHFPAFSIDRGELTVGHLREQAAKKLGSDARRIRLLYRGKRLGDNTRTCREEGLREGADVMCVTSDTAADELAARAAAAGDSSGDSGDDDGDDGEGVAADQPKRKRVRNRNKKKKGGKKKIVSDAAVDSDVPTSGTASPRPPQPPPPVPLTPMDKLNAASATLQGLKAQCQEFMARPPSDKVKRDFEHKRLSETILTQVLLKLDAVDTDEPTARALRKELVKEAQRVLNELDAARAT